MNSPSAPPAAATGLNTPWTPGTAPRHFRPLGRRDGGAAGGEPPPGPPRRGAGQFPPLGAPLAGPDGVQVDAVPPPPFGGFRLRPEDADPVPGDAEPRQRRRRAHDRRG